MAVLAPDTGHVDSGLYTAIDAATALPVHRTVPSGVAYPFIRFRCVSEVDAYVLSGRAWGRFLYDITGWDKSGSATAIKAQLGEIATALLATKITVAGGTVKYQRREGRREDDPTKDGIQYQQVIDTWAIEVIPA